MDTPVIFILCSLVVGISQGEVTLEADIPFLRVQLSNEAILHCCYKGDSYVNWTKSDGHNHTSVEDTDHVIIETTKIKDTQCGKLTIKSVWLSDSGMYQCVVGESKELTHGTYLQVYEPMKKTINLSESTKNEILIAEGVLLLLCVLLPSLPLLLKSKRLHELEKKKMKKEEENIYEGLNLDDCCTTYDQIERSQAHGPYQDVGNIMEEREDIQLEKP